METEYVTDIGNRDEEIRGLEAKITMLERKLDNSYWMWREESEIVRQLRAGGHVDDIQIGVARDRAREVVEKLRNHTVKERQQ